MTQHSIFVLYFLSPFSCRSRHQILCAGISRRAIRRPPRPGWELAGAVCCTEWRGVWDQRAGHLHNWTSEQHEPCLCHALSTQDAHPGRTDTKDGTQCVVERFVALDALNGFFSLLIIPLKTLKYPIIATFWHFLLFLLSYKIILIQIDEICLNHLLHGGC